MYRSYYGLTQKPFQLSTDPKFLWLGEKHKEALATLKYGVIDQKGFLLVSGDVGTGKTTLINALLESLEKDTLVANITDPALDLIEFFNLIALSFNIPKQFDRKIDFIVYFTQFLKKAYSENKNVLLIIDEVHSLSKEVLEHIRLLSNIELPEEKLLNIFFVGQNEIHQTLALPECRALRQRIRLVYQIEPLSENETMAYIKHRLKVAGTEKTIFTQAAIQKIYRFSNGYPRLINTICDDALLTGYTRDLKTITPDVINESVQQFASIRNPHNITADVSTMPIARQSQEKKISWVFPVSLPAFLRKRWHFWASAVSLALMIIVITGIYQNVSTKKNNPPKPTERVLKTTASPPDKPKSNPTLHDDRIKSATITPDHQIKATSPPKTEISKPTILEQADRVFMTNPGAAEMLLSKSVAGDPQNAKAHFDLGRLYTKSKEYAKAINAYQKAANLRYRPSDTFYNIGFIYASTEDYANAEKMFLHVVELKPPYLDKALFNLAVVQQKQGKMQQCIENLEKAMTANPMNQRAQQYRNQLKQ